ncbi:polysaccharide biosynthesis tyrosine autokinase [Bacteroidota bacterium]|nr:polysaccharide biosynthesis tyrosine autokinase [Bacteroidota bacterium]
MGAQSNYNLESSEESFDLKKEFLKYLYFWKFFLVTTIFALAIGFLYLRYTNEVYISTSKIKIKDKKESSLKLPTAADLFSNSKINLENEIEVIKSKPIISEVVKNLNLQTQVTAIGDIMQSLSISYPFEIILKENIDSISSSSYRLNIADKGFEIVDFQNEEKKISFAGNSSLNFKHDLPFEINNFKKNKYLLNNDEGYLIDFISIEKIINTLKSSIDISQVGKESDIVEINFTSTNYSYANIVLDELVNVFNNDGVKDRQLVHKRTIDFVNERYSFLSTELDSIEIAKQIYKAENDFIDFNINSSLSLNQTFKSEEKIFSIENQIALTNLLIGSLKDKRNELLPSNIGIENMEINKLISDYNLKILEKKKLILSAGLNNPSVKQINEIVSETKINILTSLQNHLNKLNNTKDKFSTQFAKYSTKVSDLPEKEKILRAIERNQQIKESLYLFLLQKREEAEVSFAVTEPSIKVVEFASCNKIPTSPNKLIVYLSAILIGLVLPFIILYFLFLFNNKIYSKAQLEELNLPVSLLGEIPEIDNQPNTTIFSSNERSPLAESFRVLNSNLKFFYEIIDNKKANVIMVSSTVKGEGKTFTAVNLAYTQSSLGKKVLLVGADLHNPQIHTYIQTDKNINGLVNYLIDNKFDWKSALNKTNKKINCDVLVGGQIPPNPAQLLNSGNFEKLIEEAKNIYDTIIIDTPPTLLVSDTLSISHVADIFLIVVRCNHTNVQVLDFIKDSYKKGTISKNSLLILNGLGANNKYGYGYAYNYSYGYNYKYSYNYNYGYGYEYGANKD